MASVEEQINNLLYTWGERSFSFLKIISTSNGAVAIILIIYRYGFILSDEEVDNVFANIDLVFAIFGLVYLIRFIFSIHRKEYLIKTWFEASLIVFLFFHGLINYLFEYKLLLGIIELFVDNHPVLTYQHFLTFYLVILVGLEVTKISTKLSELELKPATTFIASFIVLILIGTGLLMLPAMTIGRESMSFLNALFTSVSASCVTGLAVEDTGTYFTFKGQMVIVFLIQLGGIGIVSFATFFASFMAKGVGLKHQSIIQDHLSSESLISATALLRRVIIITLSIEFIGFVLIYFSWENELEFNSWGQKIFFSAFHSVSAFCNAGFSLFPDSLYTNYLSGDTPLFLKNGMDINIRRMYFLHFVIGLLIIFGGLGFSTIEDIFTKDKIRNRFKAPWKDWKISTRIAVYSTAILLAIGTIGFMALEAYQLTDRTILEALNTAFFQSVTTRTAGFNTMDFGGLKEATIIMVIFLMFIGACPGSTGGGIKSSTFLLIALSSIANIKGQARIEIGKRTIPDDLIRKAFSIFMFATTYNIIAIFFLTITESGNENISILPIVFEQVSAFATVGLSMGITGELSDAGKAIIIVSMYIGRVGTLTLALALSSKVKTNSYRYPDGHVMVG